MLKFSIDALSGAQSLLSIRQCAVIYVSMIMVQGIFRLSYRYNLGAMNVRAGHDIRSRGVSALINASVAKGHGLPTGEVVSRLNSDADTVTSMFDSGVITILDAAFYITTIPIILFCLSWQLALVALFSLPLIPWIVSRFDRRIRDLYREVQQHLGALSSLSQEAVAGARVVKSAAAERAFKQRYAELSDRYQQSSLRLARTEAIFGPALESVSAFAVVLVLLVGGEWVIAGGLSLGTFVAFQRYTQQLLWPMQALGNGIGLYQRAAASELRLGNILGLEPEPNGSRHEEMSGGVAIKFRNVEFSYPGETRAALSGVSFDVNPGQRVAFVGDNGSGKSTVVALLLGLHEASSGTVSINGIDVRDWDKRSLRRRSAVVTQDIFILSGSIRENIAFRDAEPLSDGEIAKAARTAALDDEIASFRDGYDTLVGERGLTLSGGQRQRLALARALVDRSVSLLVLDDVFSAVDSGTESRVRDALSLENPGRTEIIISQRLASVRGADHIFVFADGKIIQHGTHGNLSAQDGWYRRFFEEQKLEEELTAYAEALPQ